MSHGRQDGIRAALAEPLLVVATGLDAIIPAPAPSASRELFASIKALWQQSALPVAAQMLMALIRVFPTGTWFSESDSSALIAASPINTSVYFYMSFTLLYTLQGAIGKAAELAEIADTNHNESEKHTHEEEVGSHFRQGLSISCLTAALLSAVAYFTGDYFKWLGHKPEAVSVIDQYFHAFVISGGLFPLLGIVPERQLSSGLKKPRVSTAITLINAALLTGTFYAAFHEKIGPSGFGYGLSLSTWVPFIACLSYFGWASDFKKFNLFSRCDWVDQKKWKEIWKQGFPNLISNTYECLIIAVLAGLMGNASKDEAEAALAAKAFSIAILCGRVVITPSWTGGNSLNTLVKRAMIFEMKSKEGRGVDAARNKAHSFFNGGLLIYGGFSVSCGALFAWKPDYFASLFLDSAELTPALHAAAQKTLAVVAVGGVCDVARIVGTGLEKALDRNGPSAKINALGLSLGLLLAFVAQLCGAGPELMLIGFYSGVTMAAGLQTLDIYRGIAAFDGTVKIPDSAPASRFCLPCFSVGERNGNEAPKPI